MFRRSCSSCSCTFGLFRPFNSAPHSLCEVLRTRGRAPLPFLFAVVLSLQGCAGAVSAPKSAQRTQMSVTTSALPNGQVNTPYSATLNAAGGVPPYTWSLTGGALPPGLSLDASTGVISGTPTASTSGGQLTFTVADASRPPAIMSATLALTIAPSSLSITTQSLPSAQVGAAYSVTLTATGGTPPYTWSVTAGTLPAGLSLNPATGVISGTPSVSGKSVQLGFTVADSGHPVQTQSVSLALGMAPSALAVTTNSLPTGQVGTAYSTTLAANGGTPPYTWSLASGVLPAGLTLNAATGSIGGTPTTPLANGHLTFTASDSSVPAQSKSVTVVLNISPTVLSISTTSLPLGQVGATYSSGLAVTGGTPPYSWTVSSGVLPAGLVLTAATGAISGTPSASAISPLIFTVSDSSSPVQEKSTTLTLTISPANITVSASPTRSGLTETQTLVLTATTNDLAGVSWTATGGRLSAISSQNGVAVTYTAPSSPGSFTITATSITHSASSAAVTIFVTDLSGVYTNHNDLARDGANTHEYALSPSLVNTSTFGKLFSCVVDGVVYAQPLWVANLTINGAPHNVVFVATEHDSVYAFDADTAPCSQLWHASLIDGNHGGTTSGGVPLESPVPAGPAGTNYLVGSGSGVLAPEVGVTGTPVIDPSTNTLYVCAQSVNLAGPIFYQRLHAIDLFTGNEKFGGPANITSSNVTYPGTGRRGVQRWFRSTYAESTGVSCARKRNRLHCVGFLRR
jgi:hypothetical protein